MESSIIQWVTEMGHESTFFVRLFFSLMVSILFIQSGLDKVFNWKGEKDFYTSHFSKSILNGTVPILMPVITISELLAGFASAIGLLQYLFLQTTDLAILGMLFACLSIVQLFFGQRLAKDYAGAASLIPYFLLTVGGLFIYL